MGSYYDGYVPLIARLVKNVVNGDIYSKSIVEILKDMGMPITFPKRKLEAFERIGRKILVFVTGGLTLTECQIIREMGKRLFNGSFELYVGTTSILTGKRFIRQILPALTIYEP